jgi:hypothetical protein
VYWKPGTYLIFRDGHAFDHAATGHDPELLCNDRHRFFVFARENFAEPTDASCNREHRPEGTHRHARQEPGEQQGESKS